MEEAEELKPGVGNRHACMAFRVTSSHRSSAQRDVAVEPNKFK
jgi:hypothetical protein